MKNVQLAANVALYTSAQIHDIEQLYAKQHLTSTYPLMEAAGKAAYEHLKTLWPDAKRILVLTGKGNNGGDGFVLARLAAQERKRVSLYHFCSESQLKGDALKAFQKLPGNSLQKKLWSDFSTDKLAVALAECDVIIDAMLGTGIKGALKPPFVHIIELINRSTKPVLAIDIPSGLNADTGNSVNGVIKAEATATFIGYKRGLYTGNSVNYRGHVKLFDLNVPKECFLQHDFTVLSENWQSLKYKIKPRLGAAHKGDYGHCILIGGGEGMAGAMLLAASAAARGGSGKVSAKLEKGALSLVSACPEVMAKDITLKKISDEITSLNQAQSLVVGPGLGRTSWSHSWLKLLSTSELIRAKHKVWDADALNWLSQNFDYDERRILTPHPGEAARLLGISTQAVNQDRYEASAKIAQKYGGVCVLKGAGTIISDTKGLQVVCAVGNPGMASGGMGDVLAGLIGALLGQNHSLLDAATLAVCLHGEAADRAAGKMQNYRGMLASDLFDYFPALLNP